MAGDKTPVIGPWKAKISKIDRMAMIDCSPNALVFVLGVAVAAFNVFWSIAGPECIDSTWDRRAGPGKKHRKFKANGTAFGPTITPAKGSYGWSVIPIGQAAQKIGFFMGIFDGILDGVLYGSSFMRRYSGCTNLSAPFAELSMDDTVPALLPAGTFIINSWVLDDDNDFVGGPTGVSVPGSLTDLVTAAYGLSQGFNEFPPLTDCSFSSRMVWLPSGEPVRQNWGGLGYNISGTGVFYGQDIFRHPTDTALAIEVTKTAGVMFITHGFFTAVGGSFGGGFTAYKCGAKAQIGH